MLTFFISRSKPENNLFKQEGVRSFDRREGGKKEGRSLTGREVKRKGGKEGGRDGGS